MKIITEKIVDTTWPEVATYSDMQARQAMAKLGERQTELLAFVSTSMEELCPGAAEIGMYVFFVVYRMFEKSCKTKMKRISANKIVLVYESNGEMILNLEGAHDRFFERVSEIGTAKQPHVMRYILEAIMEADQDPDPVYLSEDEIGSLFLILKTVTDVLDIALNKTSRVTFV